MEKDERIIPTPSVVHNEIIKTYAEDMAKVIENDSGGLVKKIIHGEEERQKEKQNLSPQSKKNKLFMLISLLLIMLACIVFVFFFTNRGAKTVPVEQQYVPLIFNDQSILIEVAEKNKIEIGQMVLNKVNSATVTNNEIEGIYLTENKQQIGLRRFIALIESSFAPVDDTFMVSDNFLMGVVNSGINPLSVNREGFFILLKVRSSSDIFEALRAWEGKMFFDLHKFTGVEVRSTTNYLFTKNFEDGIIENKNARILYDTDGKIVLTYVFANDNSVIITNSQNAVHEIILRLSSGAKAQ